MQHIETAEAFVKLWQRVALGLCCGAGILGMSRLRQDSPFAWLVLFNVAAIAGGLGLVYVVVRVIRKAWGGERS